MGQPLLIRNLDLAIQHVPLQRLQRLAMDKVGMFHCTRYVAADSEDLRFLVCILFCMDTTVTVGVTFATYRYSHEVYYNRADVLDPLWPYMVSTFIHPITAFVVHLFLTYRIYRLTDGNRILSGFTLLLTLAVWGFGIEITVTLTILGTLAKAESIKYLITIWLSFGIAVDFYIAMARFEGTVIVTLIVLLLKSRTGFRRSNSVIHRLVGAAIQTDHLSDDESTTALPGFIAGVFTATSLIVFLKYPMSRYNVILGLAAGRTVMDTLLVRHSLREEIKGGRTPTSALRQLEELGQFPGAVTPAKGLAELQSQ
ncbi:hypothetical protein DXG01_001625 [Tephrocybe rancida]|nr:hypothetical protein DXG01_001625 [Tephrocybe rancida]